MGEKPLSIDEAPTQLGTIMGASPPDVVDAPPPGATAGSINTTRSNIKNAGSAAAAGVLPPKPFQPEPTRPGDPIPTGPLPTDTSIKKKEPDRTADAGDAGGSEPEGLAVKEQGVKVDGGAAMDSDPIPGLDVKLGKNPGGSASALSPLPEVDETAGGDDLDPMAGAAGIITTRSNIKQSGGAVGKGDAGGSEPAVGDATPAGDAAEVAGGNNPIPGVDIIIKKNPPR